MAKFLSQGACYVYPNHQAIPKGTPPPLDKPARTSRNQSELDPTSSDWIKLDPLHNTTCNYITPAYLNRETANLDIEYT